MAGGTYEENNPFLGCRGIRQCFEEREAFLTQTRAIIRARKHGNIWIVFPMVSDITEVYFLLNR
jgi:phosphotransferase system enzyme I (PtsI)